MKKSLIIMLCLGAVVPAFGQMRLVNDAKKLSGKPDKLQEARSMIKEAMQNPESAENVETYFVAGKIEFDAYDNGLKTKMINPDDPSVAGTAMADELMNGYKYFVQGLPLDSVPNEKGQIKPKRAKDMLNIIQGHYNDFFTAGADYFNNKKYYPEAYDAFMLYSSLPDTYLTGKNAVKVDSAQIATSYFNAGLAAYSGNAVDQSAEAFKKARLEGYAQPEAYIYELACWQSIAQNDESRAKEAEAKIMDVAKAGYQKFGLEKPVFVNNMINSLVSDNKIPEAIEELGVLIQQNPNNSNLYGLRGFVYDRAENDDLSESDYRKAVSLDDVDFDTLKNASKKLYRIGTKKLNDIEGSSAEAAAARENIKNEYFIQAQQIAQKAAGMNPSDSDIQNVLDSIDYSLTTYF